MKAGEFDTDGDVVGVDESPVDFADASGGETVGNTGDRRALDTIGAVDKVRDVGRNGERAATVKDDSAIIR